RESSKIGEEPFKTWIRLQSLLRGIGGSRAIIDITCHVNIGYRRLPNLSAEKGARAKGIVERNRRCPSKKLRNESHPTRFRVSSLEIFDRPHVKA
ncbi:Uncharacterized protein DBV15_09193, partial [Temnothorax longispinosus]